MSAAPKGPFPVRGWRAVFISCLLAAAPATSTVPSLAAAPETSPAASADSLAIEGEVLDAVTGMPVGDCNIAVAGLTAGTTTDARGRFRLAGVPSRRLILTATHVGYAAASLAIEPGAGAERVTLRLSPRELVTPGVTVTATRARDRETPAAFANLRGEEISARRSAEDLPVLLSELPSTTYYSDSGHGVGYTYLSIRGFDQRRISVLINGVPQNDPEDHNVYWVDFPDLASSVQDIQVQRGSGMAFYGPPAIGGSVNLLTEAPPLERGASIEMGAGSEDTRRLTAEISSGLFRDRYAVQGRYSRIRSDGYRDRSWVDFQGYYLAAARYSERSLLRADLYAGPIEDHLAYYGIAKEETESRSTRRANPIRRPDEVERFNQPHFDLAYTFRPSARLEIGSTLFGVQGYGHFDYDGSWAPLSYYRLTPEYGFAVAGDPEETYVDSLLVRAYVDNRQFGWLPQATWKARGVELIAGAELRRHRSLHWGRIQEGDSSLPPDTTGGFPSMDYVGSRRYYEYRGGKEIVSPYLHAMLRPSPSVHLMLDLQHARIRYRLEDEKFIGTDFAVPYYFWNPRAGVNLNLGGRWNAFASYSRTSREPRLKNLYDAAEASTPESWGSVEPQFETLPGGSFDFNRPLVHPETLDDYEFGAGYVSGPTRVSLNLYWMEFRDEIIKQGRVDRFGQPVTGNADRTRHRGVEIAFSASPAEGLAIGGNLAMSRNELVDYVVFDGGDPDSLDGNTIAGFPEMLGNLRVSYGRGAFSGSAAVQYVGRQFTDNLEKNSVEAAAVVHASVACDVGSLSGGRAGLRGLSLRLHVRNLFDTLYNAYGEGEKFFPAAERQVFFGVRYAL